MRKEIHPDYTECKVKCACGNEFEIRTNKAEMSVDICNECHPFFTGSEKILDAAGRVRSLKVNINSVNRQTIVWRQEPPTYFLTA